MDPSPHITLHVRLRPLRDRKRGREVTSFLELGAFKFTTCSLDRSVLRRSLGVWGPEVAKEPQVSKEKVDSVS